MGIHHAPYPLRYKRPKELILGGSKLRSYFSPFVDQSNKVHQIWWKCTGAITVCSCFPVDDILFKSGDICDQDATLSEIAPKFWRFWPPIFLGVVTPKFLTNFY